jgi:hypothetical protein
MLRGFDDGEKNDLKVRENIVCCHQLRMLI